jgi:hypothetical protein
MDRSSSFGIIDALLVFAIGLCIVGFVFALPMLRGNQTIETICVGVTLAGISIVAFFAILYIIWLRAELAKEQQFEMALLEHEQQHLERYERPIEAMNDYAYWLTGKEEYNEANRSLLQAMRETHPRYFRVDKGGC